MACKIQRFFFLSIFLCIICSYVQCHVRPDSQGSVSPELQELRKRWTASDIVRDLDHIKEDVQKIMKLQDAGQISTTEALFYFLRMHDFDDNGKLDGLELVAAMTHAMEHSQDQNLPFQEKEAIVDSFFSYDDNMDGFISYPELRRHLAPSEERKP